MKKVNFKKLTNQFLAGVFGLALMGGVMLNFESAYSQIKGSVDCSGGDQRICFEWQDGDTKHRVYGNKGAPKARVKPAYVKF